MKEGLHPACIMYASIHGGLAGGSVDLQGFLRHLSTGWHLLQAGLTRAPWLLFVLFIFPTFQNGDQWATLVLMLAIV